MPEDLEQEIEAEVADNADNLEADVVADSPRNKGEEDVAEDLPIETEIVEEINSVEEDELAAPEKEGIFAEISGILKELNLNWKQIGMIIVGFGLLLGLIGGSFIFLLSYLRNDVGVIGRPANVVEKPESNEPGWIANLWDKLKSPFASDGPVKNTDTGNDTTNNTDTNVDADNEADNSSQTDETSVTVVTDLGRSEAKPLTDSIVEISEQDRKINVFGSNVIFVVNALGQEQKLDNRLSYYARTYRYVRNTFNTDLFALLDNANDRKVAYDAYLFDFRAQYAEALRAGEELRQEQELLGENLDRLTEVKTAAEEEYLLASEQLASERLLQLLSTYQDLARQEVVVRSEFKAREQILLRYQNGLPLIAQKIEAIIANQDAFVKGVRVINFPNIQLDLVQESN